MSSRTLAVTSEELQAAWEKVKGMATLPTPPDPRLPPTSSKTSMKSRLQGIQAVICALEYNYTGTLYFDVNKNRSFKSIVSTAKDMLKEVLPIQCLEAVFLGAYLSAGLPEIDRFPVSFKTMTGDTVHRHIILAVRHQHVLQTKWGALGLSRVDGLMYKELKFHSLSELVQDYCREFGKVYHSVVKVYVGFPFSHDIHSSEKVEWRMMNLPIENDNWVEVAQHLDGFSKDSQEVLEFKRAKGELPDWYSTKFPLHTPESESGKHSPDRKRHTAEGTFGFSLLVDGGDASPPAPAKIEESPERPGPILVAPDEVVFKQALADMAQVLPTNVFLQNTTTNAFLVEIRDPSGQIEVVTKPAPTAVGNGDQGSDNNASACFRISAKGMIVVAMKYSPLSNAPETPAPVHNTNQLAVKANETRLTNSRPGAIPASAGSRGKRGRTNDTEVTSKSKPTPAIPAKQVVILRCTRLLRGDDGSEDVRDGEPYIHELPYTIKSS